MTDIKKNLSKFFYNGILNENIVETNDGVPLFPILNKFVIEDLHKNSERINIDGLKMDSFLHDQIVTKKIPKITETIILKQQDTFQFPESCSQDYPKKEIKINKIGNDINNNIKNNIQSTEEVMQATKLNSFFNNIEKTSVKQKKPRKKPEKKPPKNKLESFSINTSSSGDADSDEIEAVRRITEEENEATDIVIKDNLSYDSSYEEQKNGKEDKPGKPMLHEMDVFEKNQPRKRKNLFSKEITTIVLNSEDDSDKSFDIDQHKEDSMDDKDKSFSLSKHSSSSTSDDDKDDSSSIEISQTPKNIPGPIILESLPPIKEDVIEEKNGIFYGFPSLIDSLYDIISYNEFILQITHFLKVNEPISDESKGKLDQLLHFFAHQIAFDVRAEQKNDISKIDHGYDLIIGKAPSLKYDIINGKRQVNEESKKIKEEYIADNLRRESTKHNNNGINNDKELALISKTKKTISEDLQFTQSNHGSFIYNLLETARSTVDPNDFLPSDYINTCDNLDWSAYLIDHKFDESDFQYFKGTPLCYISGKELKIGDNVTYCRLIENDPERIDNWQGYTKPSETPYLQEKLTRSFKSYYFLKRTTIDLNTQEFSLFKMSILIKKIINHHNLSQSDNQMDLITEKPVRNKQPTEIEPKVVNNKKTTTTKKVLTEKPKQPNKRKDSSTPKQTTKRKLTKESDSSTTPSPKQTNKRKLTKETNESDSSTPPKKRKITEPTKKVVEIIAQTTSSSSKFEELLNADDDDGCDNIMLDKEEESIENPIKFYNKSTPCYIKYNTTHVIIINDLWKQLYLLSRLDYFNNGEIKSLLPHEKFLIQTDLTTFTEDDGHALFISNYMKEYQKTYPKSLPFSKISKAILDFYSLLIIPKSKQITQLLNTDIFEGSVDGINLNEEVYFLNFIFHKAKMLKANNTTNYFNNFLSKSNELNVPLYHIPIFKEHDRLWITLFKYVFCKK